MSTASLARSGRKGKSKCRTLRGKYGTLEYRYWAGLLTQQQEERFERVAYDLGKLYKDALV